MEKFIQSFPPLVVIAGLCVLILLFLIMGVAMRSLWENDIFHIRSLISGRKRRRRRRAPSLGDIDTSHK